MAELYEIEHREDVYVLRLVSDDGTNRLTRERVLALTDCLRDLASTAARPLVITGNLKFFSAGADLKEIAFLKGAASYEFSLMGQQLMNSIEQFPAPVCAAIHGYCMGGGLDLALACHYRYASPHAVFGHRGAALGLVTGWGGTQRLPRIVGKARALEIFVTAEKIHAKEALCFGLIESVDEDPVTAAVRWLNKRWRK